MAERPAYVPERPAYVHQSLPSSSSSSAAAFLPLQDVPEENEVPEDAAFSAQDTNEMFSDDGTGKRRNSRLVVMDCPRKLETS